jgi:hypothetical protein
MTFRIPSPLRLGLVLATLGAAPACSHSDTAAEPDVIVGPHTKVLDQASLDALDSVSADTATLTFSRKTPLVAALAAGDVVVLPVHPKAPNGLLRKITQVGAAGDGVVLTTAQATLGDAFERARVTFHKDFTAGDLKSASLPIHPRDSANANAGAALTIGLNNEVLYDADGDQKKTTNDQVRVSGNVSLHPSIDFNLDVENFKLQTATVSLSGAESASLDVFVGGGYTFDESLEATAFELAPITIPVGDVPLVFFPSISIKYGVKGSLSGSFEMGATQNASFTAGVGYQNGQWGPISKADFDAQLNPPSIDAKLQLRAFAGPVLNVLLYGVTGPHVGVSGYLALDGDVKANPCWNLHGGVDLDLGVKSNPIDDTGNYQTSVNVVDKSILNGSCGDAPPPDTFWSKTYSSPTLSPEDVRLTPTLDGGFVVVAKSADLILKIDSKGNVVWQRQFENFHDVRSVAALADGTYVVAGASSGGWIAKLDAGGAFLWSKRYTADPETFDAAKIVPTKDGGFFVVGTTAGADGDADVWAMKTDGTGTPLWSKKIGASGIDQAEDAHEAADGHQFVIAGTGAGDQGIALALAAADGSIQWQRQYGGGATVQSIHTIASAPNGGWMLGGTIQEGPSTHGWLVRLGADGTMQNGPFGSAQYYPSNPDDAYFAQIEVQGLAQAKDGSDTYFGVGSIWDGVSTTTRRLWAFEMALSPDGTTNVVWSRSLDAVNDDQGFAVGQLADATLVVGGTSQSLGTNPTTNLWMARTQQNGAITFPAASGVTLTSLSGKIFQTDSSAPTTDPKTPAPVPVTSGVSGFTSHDLPVTVTDDPLTLLDTTLTARALAP